MMDYEQMRAFRNGNNPYAKKMGIQVAEIGPGYARVVKTLEESDLNPVGVAHGGVFFSLADTATGSAMASHGYYAVTVSASYNYFRSGKAGDVITAEAREVKGGKTLCVFDVALTDQDGRLVGNGSFTYYNLGKEIQF